jgi:hypothetical protein
MSNNAARARHTIPSGPDSAGNRDHGSGVRMILAMLIGAMP